MSVSAAAAPRSGGTLELAEPAGGWTATLNGTALQSVPSPAGSWAQAFRLPAGGGTLDISHSQLGRTLIVVLEALVLLVVVALGLPGARVPGESTAGAGAERTAGGRRERDRDKPEGLAEPGLEPGLEPGSVPGEAEEPSRGSRLSRRAAAAGRVGAGRSGGTRAAPDRAAAGRPGRRAAASGPGASRPGAAGLGAEPGAPLSRPGAGRRGTLGPSRTQRHENENLDVFPGADPAMDTGEAAATSLGAAAGFGSDAARPPGNPPPALAGSPASGGFWDQDDGAMSLGDQGGAPWEQLGAPPLAAAERAGGQDARGQDDDPASDRGGRKRWLRGRKTKERAAPEPETIVSSAPGTTADGRGGAGHDGSWPGDAGPEYPPGQYAATGHRSGVSTSPHRLGPGDTSGPYPSPSYGSGGYPSGDYRGAGYAGPDYQGPGEDEAGYGETSYGGARQGDSRPGRAGYRSGGSGSGGSGSGGSGSAGYSAGGDSSGGYSRAGYDDSGAGYESGAYRSGAYGSGQYPQAGQDGQDGGRRLSRGRLPGDDDVLPPRRGTSSGGYPAEPGFPSASSGRRGAGYPDAGPSAAAYPGVPDYPESPGYPADSSRSDAGGSASGWSNPGGPSSGWSSPGGSGSGESGPAWSSPGESGPAWSSPGESGPAWSNPGRSGSVWPEPAAGSGGFPSPAESAHEGAGYVPAEFPAAEYPAPEYPAPEYPATEYRGGDYPGPRYPGPEERGAGEYTGTEYPGPDYPAPEDYSGSRAQVTWGREPADEPGEGDW